MSENATKNQSKTLAETSDSERTVAARSARAPLPATPGEATEQPERDRLAFFERVVWQVFFVSPFPILICAPFLFLGVFAVVALRFLFMRRRRRTSTAFGSARFANLKDMKSANLLSDSQVCLILSLVCLAFASLLKTNVREQPYVCESTEPSARQYA